MHYIVPILMIILGLICVSECRVLPHQPTSTFDQDNNITVTHTTVMSIDGTSYAMQHGKTLPFRDAELFCRREFPKKMHLLSVESEEEWLVVSKHFGSDNLTTICLGSEIKRQHNSRQLYFHWIDNSPFSYHRIAKEEFDGALKLDEVGCLMGTLLSTGEGNWTVLRVPCDKPCAFICKSEPRRHPIKIHYSDSLDYIFKLLNYAPPNARLTKYWSRKVFGRPDKTSTTTTSKPDLKDLSLSSTKLPQLVTKKPFNTSTKTTEPQMDASLTQATHVVQKANHTEDHSSPDMKVVNINPEVVTGSIAEEAAKAVAAQVILPPAELRKVGPPPEETDPETKKNEAFVGKLEDFFGFNEPGDVPILWL